METRKLPKQLEKIAIFRALQLGDLLCSIPAMHAVRAAFPTAQITLVGLPWAKNFATRYTDLFDNFIAFPGYPGLPEQGFDRNAFPSFLATVQKEQFDLVLQMHGNGSISNPLCQLFQAKITAGFYPYGGYCPDTDFFLPYPETVHEVYRHLSLISFLGIDPITDTITFPLTAEDQKEKKQIYKHYALSPRKYILLHPGSRDHKRRWDPIHFAFVADFLMDRGFPVVLTGTENERPITKTVRNYMRSAPVDLTGKTTMGSFGALVRDAMVIVANDTGISHLAAAFAVPSVIIFSPFSEPARWAPLRKELHRIITAEQAQKPNNVVAAIQTLLNANLKSQSVNREQKTGNVTDVTFTF